MRSVILGTVCLLTPEFPEKGGVGLTYTSLSLSFIPSLNILYHYVKSTLYIARKWVTEKCKPKLCNSWYQLCDMDWILATTKKNFVGVWKLVCFIIKFIYSAKYISGNKMEKFFNIGTAPNNLIYTLTQNVIYFGFVMEGKSFPKTTIPLKISNAFWKRTIIFLWRWKLLDNS